MPFTDLDSGGVARCLAQIADRGADHVDTFFERKTQMRVVGPAEGLRRDFHVEQGLAVRLLRDGRTWLASTDRITPKAFAEAVGRVARARPGAVAPPPRSLQIDLPSQEPDDSLETFVADVELAIHRRHAGFEIQWDVCRHHRASRVVGAMLAPPQQVETFFSCTIESPWLRWGSLLESLASETVEAVADSVTACYRARRLPPAKPKRRGLVLAPGATAVLLHEAVAHALETDTLALSGSPESAVGVQLAPPLVSVLDHPAGGPTIVRREIDDEGMPVVRRWLLREGVIQQPLANLYAAAASDVLTPGAGRRGDRRLAPEPRATHLEMLAGETSPATLVSNCESGLWVQEFSSGRMDPLSGRVTLKFPYARRIEGGVATTLVGKGQVESSVSELLGAVRGVGNDRKRAGAGWCAKGGHRVPFWASAPSILLDPLKVSS